MDREPIEPLRPLPSGHVEQSVARLKKNMVKRALGPLIAPLANAGEAGVPRRMWVYRSVLEALRSGSLVAGARLPSSRELAQAWRIARGAVDEAYEMLQVEGLLERRVGDGSYVADPLPRGVRAPLQPVALREPSAITLAVLRRLDPLLPPIVRNDLRPRALQPCIPDVASFPIDIWRRCVARSLEQDARRSGLWFGAPAGLPELRELIAGHLQLVLAQPCRAEQVVVVNSFPHAYDLIARVLTQPGDVVAVEDPSHASVPRMLALNHLDVRGVALDDQGLSVADLRDKAPNAAAVFLHSFNHYPLGTTTTPARAAELMRWADGSGAWIVDSHYLREFAHDGPPPPPLSTHDFADRTIVVGAFTMTMFPSLRLAFLVVPERLVDVFSAVRGMMGDHSPVSSQVALSMFLSEGHASAYLREQRKRYRERRDALRRAVARHLPPWVVPGPMEGGINAALRLPPSLPDTAVQAALAAQGVACASLSQHRWQATAHNGLAVGYGTYEPADIESAVRTMGDVLRTMAPR
jgi:GntR family transcriptional regulator / MocR family aminotransferase